MSFFKKPEKKAEHPLSVEDAKQVFGLQIMNIGKVPLSEDVSVEDIKATRKDIQVAYQEVKKRNLEMSLVDYFCWVSTQHMARIIKMATRNIQSEIVERTIKTLADLLSINGEDARNTLRLFHADYSHFFDVLQISNSADRRELFIKMSALWYDTVQKESA
jgi:hypothetical protein